MLARDLASRLSALLLVGLAVCLIPTQADAAAELAVFICDQKIVSARPSFAQEGSIWTPATPTAIAMGEKLQVSGSSFAVGSSATSIGRLSRNGVEYVSLNNLATALGAHLAATTTQVKVSARVTDVRFTGGTLKITTNLPVKYTVRSLKLPDRVYVDIPGARLEGNPSETKSQTSVVRALRVAQFDENTVRITAQTASAVNFKVLSPARSKEIAVQIGSPSAPTSTPPSAPKPGTAVAQPPNTSPGTVEIVAAPNELSSVSLTGNAVAVRLTLQADSPLQPRFGMHINSGDYWIEMANTRLASPIPDLPVTGSVASNVTVSEEQGESGPAVTIRVKSDRVLISRISAGAARGQMLWTLSLPTLSDGDWRGKLIVLDAGHGGKDSGAQGNGLVEKSQNLAIARYAREEAIKRDLNVVMTRDSDAYLTLRARTDLISKSDAHLFVSIHHNSSAKRNSATGTEVYYHMQDPESRALAEIVEEKIVKSTGLTSRGARSDSRIYKTGFFVLRNSPTPAILVEVGYLNSSSDAAKLKDETLQRKVARAIVDGIVAYLGKPLAGAVEQPPVASASPKAENGGAR